ncbi:MAG: ribonuclease III [Candidatus Roizmanbacteria bacterium]
MTELIDFSKLESSVGYVFADRKLLLNAFVHRSFLNERTDFELPSNEVLEFLGDSVLSLITSQYLFTRYPEYSEGMYTDIKAAIVRTESLHEAALKLKLGDFLLLSKGEEDNGGRVQKSILADCFEAFIAVIFLEKGYDTAKEFVQQWLFDERLDEIVENKKYLPAKNLLQEYYQAKFKQLPRYEVNLETGPQHDKTYTITVFGGKNILGQGKGKSKKEAEEKAAANALEKISL